MKKKSISILIILMVLLVVQAVPVFAAEDDPPKTDCGAALLMDAKTGEVLYESNSTKAMQPASLTKMMTALLVVENLDMNDTVTVPKEAVGITGNNIGLKEGEVFTVEQLLNALMIYSANDAAVALGIKVSGNIDSFLALMNEKAAKLGMNDTHYISPNGLVESTSHITTAKDISIIAREVLRSKTLSKIVCKTKYTIPQTNMSKERKLKSTNKLLYDTKHKIQVNGQTRTPKYEGAEGIKTGFMNASGYCLAAAVERDGTQFIAVVMDAGTDLARYSNAISMLDYGFDNYYTYKLMDKGAECGRVKVKYGHNTFVQTEAAGGAYATLPKQASKDVAESKVSLDSNVKAPIKKGTKVGVVNIYENGEKTGTADIVITKTVKKGGPWSAWYISDIAFIIICAVVLLLIILLIMRGTGRKKRKRKQEFEKRKAREHRAREIAAERADKQRREWPY
ncbi:MAG: D-alanyl-D-alanine carboxypeptidase family protein [Eubacteriaceae bacterium]|nr:D-alanyl-D-alanine carboxypeptidase family protein [Eubacteriaceae bacterium]